MTRRVGSAGRLGPTWAGAGRRRRGRTPRRAPVRKGKQMTVLPPRLSWRVIPRPSGRSWLVPIPDRPQGPAPRTPQGSGHPRPHARAACSPGPYPHSILHSVGDSIAELEQGRHDKPSCSNQQTRSEPTVVTTALGSAPPLPGALRLDTSPSSRLTDADLPASLAHASLECRPVCVEVACVAGGWGGNHRGCRRSNRRRREGDRAAGARSPA